MPKSKHYFIAYFKRNLEKINFKNKSVSDVEKMMKKIDKFETWIMTIIYVKRF